MVRGPVVSGVVAVMAVIGVVAAFANGGSPYVTMSQARKMTRDNHLHLAGDLMKDSITRDYTHHTIQFKLRDQDGTIVTVVHTGEVPPAMSEATKVVAIGHAEGDVFKSDQLLVKCPSKYEAEPKSSTPSYKSS
jgi:cytochrome c-type biogenesis protein CcmE